MLGSLIGVVLLAILCVVFWAVILPQLKYNRALGMIESKNYVEAYDTLLSLQGFKDSDQKADSIYENYKAARLKNAKPGETVLFGSYEQDSEVLVGDDEIEWLVLTVKDGRALLLSKYALDSQPYHTERVSTTWETCSLRQWLNAYFINAAFTEDERAIIPTVTVPANMHYEYDTPAGRATQDQVFLLSYAELDTYFEGGADSICPYTTYAASRGLFIHTGYDSCHWWLRTPGYSDKDAACVDEDGNAYRTDYMVNGYDVGVRPVLWVDLTQINY